MDPNSQAASRVSDEDENPINTTHFGKRTRQLADTRRILDAALVLLIQTPHSHHINSFVTAKACQAAGREDVIAFGLTSVRRSRARWTLAQHGVQIGTLHLGSRIRAAALRSAANMR